MAQTPTGVFPPDWGEQTGRGHPPRKRGFFRTLWGLFWGFIWLILATTAFFGVLAVASYLAIGYYIRGNPTQAPDLTARSVTEALEDLDKYKLSLVLDGWEASDAVEAGEIIKQNPKPGAWIKDRTAIKVTVSTGPKNEVIPNTIVGVSRREAGLRLRELNLGVSHVAYVRVPGKPNEEVVATDPPVGTGVPPNSSIKLLVASDRPGIQSLIPDLNGLTVDLAREELRRIGLPAPKVGVAANDKAQPGTIYRQVPEAGEAIRDASMVVDVTVAPAKTPDPSPTPGPAVGDLDLYTEKKVPATEGAPSKAPGDAAKPPANPAEHPAAKPATAPAKAPVSAEPAPDPNADPNADPAPARPALRPIEPGELDQTEDEVSAKRPSGSGISSGFGGSGAMDSPRTPDPLARTRGPLKPMRGADPYPEATLLPEEVAKVTPPPPGSRISPELMELAREVERRARGLATPTVEATVSDPVQELQDIVGMASERLKAINRQRAGPAPEPNESPPPTRRSRPFPTPDRPPPRSPESDAAQALDRIRPRSQATPSGRSRSQDRPRSRSTSESYRPRLDGALPSESPDSVGHGRFGAGENSAPDSEPVSEPTNRPETRRSRSTYEITPGAFGR